MSPAKLRAIRERHGPRRDAAYAALYRTMTDEELLAEQQHLDAVVARTVRVAARVMTYDEICAKAYGKRSTIWVEKACGLMATLLRDGHEAGFDFNALTLKQKVKGLYAMADAFENYERRLRWRPK